MKLRVVNPRLAEILLALLTFSFEGLGVQPAFASTGDELRKITVPVPAASGVATSLAFDGSILLYTNWGDPNLYHITPNGGLVQTVPTGLTFMTALSWDSKRNKLWVCDSGGVFLMDHMTGAADQQFTGECLDGLAYDATDDTLYMSFDARCPVYQRRATDGALLRTINCTVPNSGIVVGATDVMYLGGNGDSQIYKYDKGTGNQLAVFVHPGGRVEDLECDASTFPGKHAIWSKDAYDNTLTAFEVDLGTCVGGGGTGSSRPQGVRFRSFPDPLDPARPTIVITHGWQYDGVFAGEPPDWVEEMRTAIRNRGGLPGGPDHYNIILVMWPEAYAGSFYSGCTEVAKFLIDPVLWASCYVGAYLKASPHTIPSGHRLAEYLKSVVPASYSKAIHLIGHSFGTAVNAEAMKELAEVGINVAQVTLLDAPMILPDVPVVSSPVFYTADWYQLIMPYLGSCPWVDNYHGTGVGSSGRNLSGAYNQEVDQRHWTIHKYFYTKTIQGNEESEVQVPPGSGLAGFDFSRNGGAYDTRPDPKCWDPPLVTVLQVLEEIPGVIVSGAQKGWEVTTGFAESIADSVRGSVQSVMRMLERSSATIAADVTIPSDAAYLRFFIRFVEKGDGDWLSIYFNDTLLFTMLGTDFGASDYMEVLLPVNSLQGQTGRLVAILNSVGDPNAEVRLGTFTFEGQGAAANALPVANAGSNQTVRLGSLVTLNGRSSSDPDNGPGPLTFSWTKVSGPAVTVSGATTATPTFTPTVAGTYRFSLVVNDGQDNSVPASVTITVPILGDIDVDGDVDVDDLHRVNSAMNTNANGPNDLRDLNGDGRIDGKDVAELAKRCTRPGCGPPQKR